MKYIVFQRGVRLRETEAASAEQAVNNVRWQLFGFRPADGLDLEAVPAVVDVELEALRCTRSAVRHYCGARVVRRRSE